MLCVWCVVLVLVFGGGVVCCVLCVWCVVLVLVFGGGVVCCVGGVCFCVFVLFCFFFSQFSSFSFLLSLFPSSLSLSLLPPPSLPHQEKEEGPFYYSNISGEGIILYYSFKLIPKTRRRGKLQSLQLYINSKTIGL